jgi:hypothetical protein
MPRSRALGAAGALIAVLVLVVIAASGGGHSKLDVKTTPSLSPAPAGAPAAQQIDRLEQIVRAAPRKP